PGLPFPGRGRRRYDRCSGCRAAGVAGQVSSLHPHRCSRRGRVGSTARGRCFVLAAAVLWSLSGVITKSVDLDRLTLACYRSLFAGLVLVPLVPRSRRAFRREMVPLGLVFGAMSGLFLGSVKATTAANAIYLQYTATFWVVPLGMMFLGERPDRRTVA